MHLQMTFYVNSSVISLMPTAPRNEYFNQNLLSELKKIYTLSKSQEREQLDSNMSKQCQKLIYDLNICRLKKKCCISCSSYSRSFVRGHLPEFSFRVRSQTKQLKIWQFRRLFILSTNAKYKVIVLEQRVVPVKKLPKKQQMDQWSFKTIRNEQVSESGEWELAQLGERQEPQ